VTIAGRALTAHGAGQPTKRGRAAGRRRKRLEKGVFNPVRKCRASAAIGRFLAQTPNSLTDERIRGEDEKALKAKKREITNSEAPRSPGKHHQ